MDLTSRRGFLTSSALIGAAAVTGRFAATASGAVGQQSPSGAAGRRPIRILMGGYGPPSTGFSLALKRIGDRLEAGFGDRVEVKYVYNILDLGYRAEDILWLVEQGVLTLGYQSSSYLSRPIFVHRPTFDAWPRALQEALGEAVHDAVAFQRERHVKEEDEAAAAIRAGGGEILDLTRAEHDAFVAAVTPIYGEARREYSREVLTLLTV